MSRLTFNNDLHFRLVVTQIYHLLSEDFRKNTGQVVGTASGTFFFFFFCHFRALQIQFSFTPNYFKKNGQGVLPHLLRSTEERNMRVSKLF